MLKNRFKKTRNVRLDDKFVTKANRNFDRRMRLLKSEILRDVRHMVKKNLGAEDLLHEPEDVDKATYVTKDMYNGMQEELKTITNMIGKLMKQMGPADGMMEEPPAPAPSPLMDKQLDGDLPLPDDDLPMEKDLEVPDPEGDNDTKESIPPTAPGSPTTKSTEYIIRDEVRKTLVGRPVGMTPGAPAQDAAVATGGTPEFTNGDLFNKSWEEVEELAKGRFTTIRG
jgi:hypothetical protein